MSFRENLIKARSHIIFLVALAAGLGAVTALENGMGGFLKSGGSTMRSGQTASMLAFDAVTPLPVAIVGKSSAEDLASARIAWRYFQNNTNPKTGLANSVDGYPSTTMWEAGSYFVAVVSADLLGIIEPAEARARITLALDTFSKVRLFDNKLPNKAYHAETAELVDYSNKPVERGLGWSALDISRLVATMGQIKNLYPDLAPKVAAVMDRWDMSLVIGDGQLYGGNMIDGELRRDQEGRVGYGQYAARAMMLFGHDMYKAYNAAEHLMVREVQGQPIPIDDRLHRNVTPAFAVSEPYVFDGLEFGFDARSHLFATAIYLAQEARYRETGLLTAVSESHLNQAPYFAYASVWGGGEEWAVLSFKGERMDSKRTLTTKTAFAWDALFGTEYSRKLVAAVLPLGDPERGWAEGIYEIDGSTNTSVTANTNAVILAALAFRAHGPLIKAGP
jgi:hypothetical protein